MCQISAVRKSCIAAVIGEGDAGNELWFLKVESDSAVDDASY